MFRAHKTYAPDGRLISLANKVLLEGEFSIFRLNSRFHFRVGHGQNVRVHAESGGDCDGLALAIFQTAVSIADRMTWRYGGHRERVAIT